MWKFHQDGLSWGREPFHPTVENRFQWPLAGACPIFGQAHIEHKGTPSHRSNTPGGSGWEHFGREVIIPEMELTSPLVNSWFFSWHTESPSSGDQLWDVSNKFRDTLASQKCCSIRQWEHKSSNFVWNKFRSRFHVHTSGYGSTTEIVGIFIVFTCLHHLIVKEMCKTHQPFKNDGLPQFKRIRMWAVSET